MKIKPMLIYLFILGLGYYLLPFLIQDTGSAMLLLLVVLPLLTLICSYLYGAKHSFHFTFPLLVMLLFIPTIFIHYNESAMIYTWIFGSLSLIGMTISSKLLKSDNH